MPRSTKPFLHLLEYALLRGIAAILGLLPLALVYFLARGLSLFGYHLLRLRRQTAITNLFLALGKEQPPRALEKICRESYIQIGMTFIELLIFSKLTARISRMVELPDIEPVRRYTGEGRGVVMVTGHFGSWEMAGAALAGAGIPFTVIAAHQSNRYVDAMINRGRIAAGMQVVTTTDASVKQMIRALKDGKVIGLVSDQDAGESGAFVNFFGRPASTPPGAAQLALKYKTPLFVIMLVRTKPGRYCSITREVEIKADDTVESLTQRYTTIMEEIIRQHPEQYLWMHRRWKSRPA
ncbi:MAG: hypothetical protein A2521_03880 [Deltaproteobacteria bacterium RIFOXYD12_FULL_57_12]|nr:MAG: hypothetical protein A2521_03880 [Deltaproteobacteria bacterium RIFOXYD12_FULL_57_12]